MIRYSENTDYYKAKILSNLPAYYIEQDASGDFDKMITIMAEMLACGAMNLRDLLAQMRISRAKDDFLTSFAENFGLWIDPEYMENQRAFIALAARWIDRKGVKKGMQALIASFGQDALIKELRVIYPVVEDTNTKLTCGMTHLRCGMALPVDIGSPLYELSQIGNMVNIEINDYDVNNVKLTKAIRKSLEFLTPIYITINDFVAGHFDGTEEDYLYTL